MIVEIAKILALLVGMVVLLAASVPLFMAVNWVFGPHREDRR